MDHLLNDLRSRNTIYDYVQLVYIRFDALITSYWTQMVIIFLYRFPFVPLLNFYYLSYEINTQIFFLKILTIKELVGHKAPIYTCREIYEFSYLLTNCNHRIQSRILLRLININFCIYISFTAEQFTMAKQTFLQTNIYIVERLFLFNYIY